MHFQATNMDGGDSKDIYVCAGEENTSNIQFESIDTISECLMTDVNATVEESDSLQVDPQQFIIISQHTPVASGLSMFHFLCYYIY